MLYTTVPKIAVWQMDGYKVILVSIPSLSVIGVVKSLKNGHIASHAFALHSVDLNMQHINQKEKINPNTLH